MPGSGRKMVRRQKGTGFAKKKIAFDFGAFFGEQKVASIRIYGNRSQICGNGASLALERVSLFWEKVNYPFGMMNVRVRASQCRR